jgi:hypothetical protein
MNPPSWKRDFHPVVSQKRPKCRNILRMECVLFTLKRWPVKNLTVSLQSFPSGELQGRILREDKPHRFLTHSSYPQFLYHFSIYATYKVEKERNREMQEESNAK